MIRHVCRCVYVCLIFIASVSAQQAGRIEGIIKDSSGAAAPDITVRLSRGEAVIESRITDGHGAFAFEGVNPGKYVVSFSAADGDQYQLDAEVRPGATLSLIKEMSEDTGFLERVTVYTASRETEKLIDAPASITIVDPVAKDLYGGAGQVPAMLASIPGAELTQRDVAAFSDGMVPLAVGRPLNLSA